jgi:hypothetical protein
MTTPSGVPRIIGWANYKDLLDGHPVFVTGFNVMTGNLKQFEGTGVSLAAQRAIVEGAEYLWEEISCSQSASVLWRTSYDGDSVVGLSGATLCLGRPSDETCRAVCFQNFEMPLRREQVQGDHKAAPGEGVARPTIKGGFLLPEEIRCAEILVDSDPLQVPPAATYPRRERGSLEIRRSLSSHQ